VSARLPSSLPIGWTTPPVYARFSVQLGKMLDEKRIAGTHLASYLRNVDVQWDHINTADLPEMDFSAEDRERFSLREGDLLVCEGGEVGRTAIWDGRLAECYFQKAIHRLRPITAHDEPRFFRYFMRTAVESGLFALATASTIQHLPAEKLRIVRYPAPPRLQQRAIADYLDRETARLDALVAAKQRVLGLLAEKRRALITRAVTRGLDPRAPLRDSGIPWLSEIPAHWKVLPLKYGFSRIGSGTTPPTGSANYYDGDVPWVTTSELRENVVTSTNESVTQEALSALSSLRTYPTGSLLFAMYGATIGRIAVLGVEATVNQAVCVLADATSFETWFTFFSLQASREHLIVQASGAGQPNLNAEIVRNHRIACPPLQTQETIVEYIVAESVKSDALRSATERTIGLLKERRAALIAAAVTGQMDIGAIA